MKNRDVIDIFLDALPTRTDVFMGQSSDWQSLVDKDNDYMTPNISKMDTKMGIRSVRGLTKIDSDMFQYAPDTGRPIFTNNVLDQYALTPLTTTLGTSLVPTRPIICESFGRQVRVVHLLSSRI